MNEILIDVDAARAALRQVLWELPAEFSGPFRGYTRHIVRIIKQDNIRRVHDGLWDLQELLDMEATDCRAHEHDIPLW